jgi:hypothetical protein
VKEKLLELIDLLNVALAEALETVSQGRVREAQEAVERAVVLALDMENLAQLLQEDEEDES